MKLTKTYLQVETEYWKLCSGPAWAWWVLAILPLDTLAQVDILTIDIFIILSLAILPLDTLAQVDILIILSLAILPLDTLAQVDILIIFSLAIFPLDI